MKKTNNLDNENAITFQQIESFIQHNENVCIPAILFEYNTSEQIIFDEFDLYNFFEKFGEIIEFQFIKNSAIVLFRSFFSANTCREFLNNGHNFKDNQNNKINVRWFNLNKDIYLLPDFLKEKFYNIFLNNSFNLKSNIFNIGVMSNINNNKNINQNFPMKHLNANQIKNHYYNIHNNINIIQNSFLSENFYHQELKRNDYSYNNVNNEKNNQNKIYKPDISKNKNNNIKKPQIYHISKY
jgi:hypothetical protein